MSTFSSYHCGVHVDDDDDIVIDVNINPTKTEGNEACGC